MQEPIEYLYQVKYHIKVSTPGIKEFQELARKLKIEKENIWSYMLYEDKVEVKAPNPETARKIVQEDLEKRVSEAREERGIYIVFDRKVDLVLNMEFYHLVERKISRLFSPPTGDNREYDFTNEVATSISEIAQTREEAEVAYDLIKERIGKIEIVATGGYDVTGDHHDYPSYGFEKFEVEKALALAGDHEELKQLIKERQDILGKTDVV